MHIGFFNYYEFYNGNRMFKEAASPIGDDLIYPFVYLGKSAEERNIRVSTIDTKPLASYDAILFIEFPTLKNKYFKQLIDKNFENLYLLSLESEIIRPENCDVNNHIYFRKIFTYNDNIVDNKKYFKINYAHNIPRPLKFELYKKKKLCALIAGHKYKFHPLELYTERVKAIRWFEQKHPEDFDLYGIGWDRHYFHGAFLRLNRFKTLTGLFNPQYPSFKGAIKSKREILDQYKFSICYENARDITGYISEKIFDCFFAGCVPVYLGAENVCDHIPANTFIDRRKFHSYEELYNYLKEMPNEEYLAYLCAITCFLESDKVYPFSVECFANTILNEIADDIV